MPTKNADDAEIEKDYEDLNNLIGQTKPEANLIVIRDTNAIVRETEEGTIMEQYEFGNRND